MGAFSTGSIAMASVIEKSRVEKSLKSRSVAGVKGVILGEEGEN